MENIYLPSIAVIVNIQDETPDVKKFTIKFKDEKLAKSFDYRPGQFLEVSVFGYGEAPVSITSTPTRRGFIELAVKSAGSLTEQLHKLERGDEIGIRGPYGNGFPVEDLFGKDLFFVAGGIGLAPLRSLINYVFDNKKKFGEVVIAYGARTPADVVFKKEVVEWEKHAKVIKTVDFICDMEWECEVGVVTNLIPKVKLAPEKSKAIVCGPPVMIPFVITALAGKGFKDHDIISTLERHMKCGVGKCSHCNIGPKYTCVDGPVFTYAEMKQMTREF
jgi:sulfite reductase subunit B